MSPPTRRTILIANISAFLSTHGIVFLFRLSIVSLSLGLCSAIFLSNMLVYCETLEDTTYNSQDVSSHNGNQNRLAQLSQFFPRRPTFVVQTRMIALLTTLLLGIVIFVALGVSYTGLSISWLLFEIATVCLEFGKLLVICLLVLHFHFRSDYRL